MSTAVALEHISTESEPDDLVSTTKTVTAEVRFDADGRIEGFSTPDGALWEILVDWTIDKAAVAVWDAMFAHRRCGTERNLYLLAYALCEDHGYEELAEYIRESVGGVDEWKAKRQETEREREAERERQEAERERAGLLRFLSTEPALAP